MVYEFTWLFWRSAPRLCRKHNPAYRHEAFWIEKVTFRPLSGPVSLNTSLSWRPHGSLDAFKNAFKTSTFLTIPLFGPTRPAHIRIKVAIQGLSDEFFTFQPYFFILFMKMCSLRGCQAQFWRSTQSIFHQNYHFFDVETARIGPVLVMVFAPVALLFVPFPSWSLHVPEVGRQKTSEKCVLLLQVASLRLPWLPLPFTSLRCSWSIIGFSMSFPISMYLRWIFGGFASDFQWM